ncbi:DNA repair protein Rad52/59/22, partial [Dactylonectria macrodidyma]
DYGKWILNQTVRVRITVFRSTKCSTFHEGTGFGGGKPMKMEAEAIEGDEKEAETDTFKRALKNFSEVLGNRLYNKDYL